MTGAKKEKDGILSQIMVHCFRYRPYIWYGKGVFGLEALVSFLLAVTAGVVSHLICKWLDSRK